MSTIPDAPIGTRVPDRVAKQGAPMSDTAKCTWCPHLVDAHMSVGCQAYGCDCTAWGPTGLGRVAVEPAAKPEEAAREATCARCGVRFPWFASAEDARDSIACCDACHPRIAVEIDEELREKVAALEAQLTEARAERDALRARLPNHPS